MPVEHSVTLAIALLGPQHFPTGETTYYVDPPEPDVRPTMLRIVRYEGDVDGVYLLYCDDRGFPLLDTFHNTLADAEEQARVALQVQADNWHRRKKRVKTNEELLDALFEFHHVIFRWQHVQPRIVVDAEVYARLIMLSDDLATAIAWDRKLVSKSVVGMSWHIFTELLREAPYAADPAQVTDAAWRWQERLQDIFGPRIAG
jgi:hypothetical protein